MGGIFFAIINKSSNFNLSNHFLTSFNKVKGTATESIFEIEENIDINKMAQNQLILLLSRRQIYEYKHYSFVFGKHSLLINDTTYDAHQPFIYPIDHYKLAHKHLMTIPQKKMLFSGEIYNTKELQKDFQNYELISDTDCQVILPMYHHYGIEKTLSLLNGEFSFVLTDNLNTCKLNEINIFVVRDRFGTKPMYIIYNQIDEIYFFVSELKSIPNHILSDSQFIIDEIPPGSYWSYQNSIIEKNTHFINYYNLEGFKTNESIEISKTDPDTLDFIYHNIKELITKSIINRIPQKGRFGILLSGGFDSSLISSIIIDNVDPTRIVLFTIGNCQDNVSSQLLVKFLETKFKVSLEHHIVDIEIEDVLLHFSDTITRIIQNLEMYDPDTIRDAIPQIYLFDYIKKFCPDIKILISGDALDEIANGYPESEHLSDFELLVSNVDLISNICKFDILRTEKLSNSFSIEMRYPYLDNTFIEFYLKLSQKLRKRGVYNVNEHGEQMWISKFIIRKSFNIDTLPDEIMWRDLSWSAQCIDTLEDTLQDVVVKIHQKTEMQFYKAIYDEIYPVDINKSLWNDYFN